ATAPSGRRGRGNDGDRGARPPRSRVRCEARGDGAQRDSRRRRRVGAERRADDALRAARRLVIVLKFGGTSVADADAVRRTSSIVSTRLDRGPIVVVSALGGVTNSLIALAEQAARGHLLGALASLEGLRDRHLGEAERLLGDASDSVETC